MASDVKFGGFKTVDNIHDDVELPHDVLRRAVNVDILDSGRLRRRKGSASALVVSGAHSLWSNGSKAYFVLSNTLREFFENGTSASLGAFPAQSYRVAYCEVGGSVFATSKSASGVVVNGTLSAWGGQPGRSASVPGIGSLQTAYVVPPPLGTALAYTLGRIFIVDAQDPKVVWFTEALDYYHVDLRKNFYQFESTVTAIAGVADGLYVCAGSTYFIAGAGSAEASQRVVLEFGAIEGSVAAIPDTTDAIWMTPRGPAIGKDGGIIELMAEKSVVTGGMMDAASMVREKDSVRQFVVVGSNLDASALQAGSYAEAEIVRRSA